MAAIDYSVNDGQSTGVEGLIHTKAKSNCTNFTTLTDQEDAYLSFKMS